MHHELAWFFPAQDGPGISDDAHYVLRTVGGRTKCSPCSVMEKPGILGRTGLNPVHVLMTPKRYAMLRDKGSRIGVTEVHEGSVDEHYGSSVGIGACSGNARHYYWAALGLRAAKDSKIISGLIRTTSSPFHATGQRQIYQSPCSSPFQRGRLIARQGVTRFVSSKVRLEPGESFRRPHIGLC